MATALLASPAPCEAGQVSDVEGASGSERRRGEGGGEGEEEGKRRRGLWVVDVMRELSRTKWGGWMLTPVAHDWYSYFPPTIVRSKYHSVLPCYSPP